MSKTISTLAVVALLATPTFASAQSIAASLSASFGEYEGSVAVGDFPEETLATVTAPVSVSVSGAIGYIAVATSAATSTSTTSTSGATSDGELAPVVASTYNDTTKAYESTVAFTPVIDAEDIARMVCDNGFFASQGDSSVTLGGQDVTVINNNDNAFENKGQIDPAMVNVANGAITVNCGPGA